MTKFEEEVKRPVIGIGQSSIKPALGKAVEFYTDKVKEYHNAFSDMNKYIDHIEDKLDCANERIVLLEGTVDDLNSQLQQQALPVVPEDVAKLPPFDDMKEYVLDDRLLTIRGYLNKLDEKSNSDITEAEAWCLIHEDIAYRAMLDGYTVEKPQLFYLKNKLTGDCLAICLARASSGLYVEVTEKWLTRKEQTSYKLYFTQQEIESMQTGSYEKIEVAE